jgi:hypothetical protein
MLMFIHYMNIRQKPYHLLAIISLMAALFSLLPLKWRADINLHDTYLVMQYSAFLRLWAALLLAIWVVNLISSRLLQSVRLSWLHTAAILLAFLGSHFLLIEQTPVRYSASSVCPGCRSYLLMRLPLQLVMVLFSIGLAALLINVVVSARSAVRSR